MKNDSKLSENALYLLQQRYLKRDEKRRIVETPEDMFRRVAHTIALVENKYGWNENQINELENKFYSLMTSLSFLPNSPTLMNAGTSLGQLSACFGIPIEDSIESIMEACKKGAIIHKSGGGTGFSFSNIRPKGDIVRSTGGIASGVVSFMSIFNATTNTIKQGGRRRGANIGILRCDHPEILDFVSCKEKEDNFTNFNISVAVTDNFMDAVEKDTDFDLINPRTGMVDKTVRARMIWNLILVMGWKNGEPGLLFIDSINKHNPTPELGEIEIVNPCSELPLLAYESCNLGSINLSKFIRENKIQWKELEESVKLGVRFLDNVIDANVYPFKEIEEITKGNRKIGLGIMGWADFLILKNIRYGSNESFKLARKVMKFINDVGRDMSRELGKEKGSFPNKESSIWKEEKHMRNATITTIAPTGSISIIANCSNGIEPLFSVAYKRHVKDSLGKDLFELNNVVKEILKSRGLGENINNIPEDLRSVIVTANQISSFDHIRMQASFQKYVDNSISKTINMPSSSTVYDIEEAYLEAYKSGCKGVTIYRNKSRNNQLLTEINSLKCEICDL